ncbi:hypothetical protein [Burkholderia territorii]|uniref:hypothetical protein n=1 Tax=Burkholderia territorii TaxID=1503055 RepID=UPI000A96001D|nr:hypothetical protein [Burkholderia territorii]
MLDRRVILSFVAAGLFCTMASTHAQAQTVNFDAGANAVSGTVKKCLLNVLPILCTTTTIAPVDQSTTNTSGANDMPVPNVSQTIYGVEIYNFSNVDDSTNASNTVSSDYARSTAKTDGGRLLQGLVKWTLTNWWSDFVSSIAGGGGNSTGTVNQLTINGERVPAGTYSAGSIFDVSGTITDRECLLGTEKFTGKLTALTSMRQANTSSSSLDLTGWRLTGQASCITAGLLTQFTTEYDLKVAGLHLGANNPSTFQKGGFSSQLVIQ